MFFGSLVEQPLAKTRDKSLAFWGGPGNPLALQTSTVFVCEGW